MISYKGKELGEGIQDSNNGERKDVSWKPPNAEFFKINVDASFVKAINAASVGVVVRNHIGEVIISSWDYIGACYSAEEAEIRATISGLYIGITLHQPIILETDCSFVAGVLENYGFDRSPLVDLKKEAFSISKMLPNVKISKISRKANKVAHEIAKFSFNNKSDGVLINSVLACVEHVVLNDCINILS